MLGTITSGRWSRLAGGRLGQVLRAVGKQNDWSLVALGRWSLRTGRLTHDLRAGDFDVVVVGRWSHRAGGRITRFDCIYIYKIKSLLTGVRAIQHILPELKTRAIYVCCIALKPVNIAIIKPHLLSAACYILPIILIMTVQS